MRIGCWKVWVSSKAAAEEEDNNNNDVLQKLPSLKAHLLSLSICPSSSMVHKEDLTDFPKFMQVFAAEAETKEAKDHRRPQPSPSSVKGHTGQ